MVRFSTKLRRKRVTKQAVQKWKHYTARRKYARKPAVQYVTRAMLEQVLRQRLGYNRGAVQGLTRRARFRPGPAAAGWQRAAAMRRAAVQRRRS